MNKYCKDKEGYRRERQEAVQNHDHPCPDKRWQIYKCERNSLTVINLALYENCLNCLLKKINLKRK